MFTISLGEILVVLLVAFLVLDPKQMPVLARNIGRWVGKAKSGVSSFLDEMKKP